MKKNVLTLILAIVAFTTAQAQEISEANSTKYVYCEMIDSGGANVTISVDYGQEKNHWKGNTLKDEQTGKARVFNTTVDALNYLGEDGWELVNVYITSNPHNLTTNHWIFKKKVSKKEK